MGDGPVTNLSSLYYKFQIWEIILQILYLRLFPDINKVQRNANECDKATECYVVIRTLASQVFIVRDLIGTKDRLITSDTMHVFLL